MDSEEIDWTAANAIIKAQGYTPDVYVQDDLRKAVANLGTVDQKWLSDFTTMLNQQVAAQPGKPIDFQSIQAGALAFIDRLPNDDQQTALKNFFAAMNPATLPPQTPPNIPAPAAASTPPAPTPPVPSQTVVPPPATTQAPPLNEKAALATAKALGLELSADQIKQAAAALQPVKPETLNTYINYLAQAREQNKGPLSIQDLQEVVGATVDTAKKNGDTSGYDPQNPSDSPFQKSGDLFANWKQSQSTPAPAQPTAAPPPQLVSPLTPKPQPAAAAPPPAPPPAAATPAPAAGDLADEKGTKRVHLEIKTDEDNQSYIQAKYYNDKGEILKDKDGDITLESDPLADGVTKETITAKINALSPEARAVLIKDLNDDTEVGDSTKAQDTLDTLAKGNLPKEVEDANKPTSTPAAAPPSPDTGPSKKEQWLNDIIVTGVDSDEHIRAKLQLKSETFIKQYHDTLMGIAKGNKITDRNDQERAMKAADQGAMVGQELLRNPKSHDDLAKIAGLVGNPALSPTQHALTGQESGFRKNMARLSEKSLDAFRQSLEDTADELHVKTIPPGKLQDAIKKARDKAIEVGEAQAKAHSDFDYLQPGQTQQFLDLALQDVCEISPAAAPTPPDKKTNPGAAAPATTDAPGTAVAPKPAAATTPAPTASTTPQTARPKNTNHRTDDQITEDLNKQELARVTGGTPVPVPAPGSGRTGIANVTYNNLKSDSTLDLNQAELARLAALKQQPQPAAPANPVNTAQANAEAQRLNQKTLSDADAYNATHPAATLPPGTAVPPPGAPVYPYAGYPLPNSGYVPQGNYRDMKNPPYHGNGLYRPGWDAFSEDGNGRPRPVPQPTPTVSTAVHPPGGGPHSGFRW